MTPLASYEIHTLAEVFADAPSSGLHFDGERCATYAKQLAVMSSRIAALETVALSVNLLGQREFTEAVRALPIADRRTIARETLRRAEGKVVRPAFRQRPAPSRWNSAAEFVDDGSTA